MKWFSLIFVLLSLAVFAGEELEVELSSGSTISIDTYASDGDTLFLYLPYSMAAECLSLKAGCDLWNLGDCFRYYCFQHFFMANQGLWGCL